MKRFEDWQDRLKKFLEENKDRPFRWGSFDCCLFACNSVRAITGIDLATPFRGQYHNMLGAMRLTRGSLEEFVRGIARDYEIPEQAMMDARPGDVVLANPDGRGDTLGVVDFFRFFEFSSNVGLAKYPAAASHCRIAWRIG